MRVESDEDQRVIQRWSRLAIQLVGAADSNKYPHLTTMAIVEAVRQGDIFTLLMRELPDEVWAIARLTDVDRHTLTKLWQGMAVAYEPRQFHIERSGLSLLAAYLLHSIDSVHAIVPT